MGARSMTEAFAVDHGYNRRIGRGSRTAAWLPRIGPEPAPFALFRVVPVVPASRDNRCLNALLLGYGPLSKLPVDPVGRIRDYLVALDREHRLLVGHASLAVRRLRPVHRTRDRWDTG